MTDTAVSAAPSTSASPTQPSPGPDVAAATVPAAPDTQVRLAKPLKPIPSLPGVFPDDDPFPPPPPSRSAATADPAKGGNGPVRGPDGRFVAGTSSPATTDIGEHTPQPGDQLPPQPATKFKIAGEEHESQEKFEQQYKSLKGQFRPLQSLARSLGGVDKIIPQFSQAAESARGWKAEAERLRAELEGRGLQPANTPSSPTAPDADAATEADVDWELYAEVKKLATESGEPWKAEQWLIEQVRRTDRAHVQKLLDERLAPLADAEAQQAISSQVAELFRSLAQYTNSDNTVAYPELHDEAAAYEIGKMWASIGLPPEAALTPQGAIAAIAIYRMAKGNRGSQAGPAPAAPTPPPPATPPVPTDARSAADLGGEGRVPTLSAPGNGATSPSAEAARIIAGLRQANSGNRNLLGFDA